MAETITKEEYMKRLKSFISEEMLKLPADGRKSTTFWLNFNKEKQAEFDAQLEANSIIVE